MKVAPKQKDNRLGGIIKIVLQVKLFSTWPSHSTQYIALEVAGPSLNLDLLYLEAYLIVADRVGMVFRVMEEV